VRFLPSHRAQNIHQRQSVESLQDGPRDVLIPELEPQEKPVITHSLAVDHLTQHGYFPFRRRNFCLLAHAPRGRGLQANSVRADIVGKSSFGPLLARASRRRKFHLHHDG